MSDVAIVGSNGRTLRISQITADVDGGWRYTAGLRLEGAEGAVDVYGYGSPQLPTFFAELAAAWQGFEGERRFQSLEGQLTITARHDGVGTITCLITLGQPWPPAWSLQGELDLGAGAHLEGISSDLAAAFVSLEPRRPT